MHRFLRLIAACLAPILAFLTLPAMATEAEPAEQTARASASVPAIRPALWKIADEDTTIYLFGTIHILPDGIDWFGGEVAQAFAASGSLVTEIAEDDPAKMQSLLVNLAMLPQQQTLRALLTDEQRTAYEGALAHYGIPPGMFDRFEPWYAAVALSTMPLMQEGFDSAHGVEELLDARAKARGVAHTGLETPEYQLGLFDALPEDVQRRYLNEVIGQLPTMRQDIGAMIEAWKHGNAEELARIMNAGESDPVLVQTLLTDRNKAWAAWLDERLATPGTVFVAVGAGHLAGPGCVQDQLAELGIASERLQ